MLKIQRVVILGGHIQALGLARQIKACGLRTIVVVESNCAVARWSKCVDEVKVYSNWNRLFPLIQSIVTPDTMLFPTSDEYIELLVKHRTELEPLCYVALPRNEVVSLFANKRDTYQFCERNNIAHPHSFYPHDMNDVFSIAKRVDYPCVVKPGVMYSFHKLLGKKAFLVQNEKELIMRMEQIKQAGFPIHLMLIQEFLAGGAKELYSFGTFAVDGKSLVDIQVNRIRQNPMIFGNSTTYCHTVNIPQIEQAAKEILYKTHYTGMGEVEFMYDKNTGDYKFLEINTRAWKWHTISNQLGFSFIRAWIEWLNEGKIETNEKQKEAAWCEHLTDTVVVMKEIVHGRMSVHSYLQSMCRKKEFAVWSWIDPLPAIMYLLLSPILYIKRY